jgi:ribose-phosphate pyrophosphokinase
MPVDHLTALPVLAEYLAAAVSGPVTVVSPDAGGGKLMRRYANRFEEAGIGDVELAFIDKRRPKGIHNVAVAGELIGSDVEGRSCIIVDDMIDTAGTVTNAAQLLHDRGAADVIIAATHGLLSGPAVERLRSAPVREVVVTNTLPIPAGKQFPKLKVLSIAPLVAEAIDAIFEDTSVSELFHGDNF